jgi:hypothetical protein
MDKKTPEMDSQVWGRHAKALSRVYEGIIESLDVVTKLMGFAENILAEQEVDIIHNPRVDRKAAIKDLSNIQSRAEQIRRSAAGIAFCAGEQKLEAGYEVPA